MCLDDRDDMIGRLVPRLYAIKNRDRLQPGFHWIHIVPKIQRHTSRLAKVTQLHMYVFLPSKYRSLEVLRVDAYHRAQTSHETSVVQQISEIYWRIVLLIMQA